MATTVHGMAARSVRARLRIGHYIYQTPLLSSRMSCESGENNEVGGLFFKAENFQYTGSFKFRGAMAKMSVADMEGQLVTSSSGNHGIATARAAQLLNKKLTIVLPVNVVASKLEKIKSFPVEVILHGEESGQAEHYARQLAARENYHYISPYNDLDVIAGQGTIALELLKQAPRIDNVFVSMGGGGLISGIACVLKAFQPQAKIYGVAAKNSNTLSQSMQAGRVIETQHYPTLADGVSGGIDENTLTLPLSLATVDEVIECDEEQIITSLKILAKQENMLVEGAAALALAGFRQRLDQCCGATNIVVLCGANFDADVINKLVLN